MEILSPSTAYYDLKPKKAQYAGSGVKEYWIVDPAEKTVEVFENVEGKMVLFAQAAKAEMISSKLLEGFHVPLSEIF